MVQYVAVENTQPSLRYVLYYAGPCPLCNRVVRWMSRHQNSQASFNFRPLPEAREEWLGQGLPSAWWEAPDSVLLQDELSDRWYRESEAVLRAIKGLDKRYRPFVAMIDWIPRRVLDWCYRRILPATSLRPSRSS
ncbi:MAG: thiol-disulfide oxidoreductase DCC family protein [Bacteroidota bacterium]